MINYIPRLNIFKYKKLKEETSQKTPQHKDFSKFLMNVLGIRPRNLDIYKMAFTHSSTASKNLIGNAFNNERLEYLGDAVLNAIIADYLFKKFPLHLEGPLTEMRAKIVCREHLNKLSQKMGLSKFIIIEPHCRPKSLYGNTFEALIGAIYLDKGYRKTKHIIINKILLTFMNLESVLKEEHNYKSKLINWAQRRGYKIRFDNKASDNFKGKKMFISQCYLNNKLLAEAEDFVVKRADQLAAEKAWIQLNKEIENG